MSYEGLLVTIYSYLLLSRSLWGLHGCIYLYPIYGMSYCAGEMQSSWCKVMTLEGAGLLSPEASDKSLISQYDSDFKVLTC